MLHVQVDDAHALFAAVFRLLAQRLEERDGHSAETGIIQALRSFTASSVGEDHGAGVLERSGGDCGFDEESTVARVY